MKFKSILQYFHQVKRERLSTKEAYILEDYQYFRFHKHLKKEVRLTSEAAYSEGEVAALLYRDVPKGTSVT